MSVDRKIARRWKIKLKKGLGSSFHISRTTEDIGLKFGTHVFLINISLHTKDQQILRGWVTNPIFCGWFHMEWPCRNLNFFLKIHTGCWEMDPSIFLGNMCQTKQKSKIHKMRHYGFLKKNNYFSNLFFLEFPA